MSEIERAGSVVLMAMGELEEACRGKGYDDPKATMNIGGVGPFWMTLQASGPMHEFFYGADLAVIFSNAEAWIETLPSGDSLKRALAPWFEMESEHV